MIRILAVGALKAAWAREACADYQRRCRRWNPVEVVEVDDRDPSREGRALLAARGALPLVVCDRRGEDWDTPELARWLARRGSVAFALGGPEGHGEEILAAADACWRFGRITLPHELARVILLEQIYRALSIDRGHPYHR